MNAADSTPATIERHANTPHSVSWSAEIESIISRRCTEESGMNRSEYVRKCIREEAERAQAMRIQRMITAAIPGIPARA